jgi:hypothetical protein
MNDKHFIKTVLNPKKRQGEIHSRSTAQSIKIICAHDVYNMRHFM